MNQSTLKFASAHDHLDFRPAIDLVIASNWVRHFAHRHPTAADIAEWAMCTSIATATFLAALIFNS